MGLEEFMEQSTEETKNKTHHRSGVSPANKITDEELIESLRQFSRDEEEKLTYTNFNNNKEYPSSRTIEKRFGSWNKGLEAAGLDKNREIVKIDITQDMYEPSADKGYIVGVLLGDGWINQANSIGLNSVDKEFVEQFGKRLCEWADLNWDGLSSSDTEIGYQTIELDKDEHNTQHEVKKGITGIQEHMKEYKYEDSKDIEDILEEFKNYKVELFRGLWDSEGWVRKDGRICFRIGEDKFRILYQNLLSDVLDIDKNEIYNVKREKDEVVYIPSRYKDRFFDIVNPTIKRKVNKYKDINMTRLSSEGIKNKSSSPLDKFRTE